MNTSSLRTSRAHWLSVATAACMLLPAAAFAHTNVYFGVNLGGYYPAPAYPAPPPAVVVAPPPRYYAPPPVIYYGPRPVYYDYRWHRDGWRDRRDWRDHDRDDWRHDRR